ncbi:helix-turn-helix domain-containing protein [Armatimonas sp.]|uniref:helix-turn-helix domain-containing protein n=1 Tax=Armatimonas sp. TaxID=1872638 RepID=UPI0037533B6E
MPELKLAKERELGRKLPYRTLAEETGLAIGTLQRLMETSGEIERIDGNTLSRLCDYFGVSLGELLVYVPGQEPELVASS